MKAQRIRVLGLVQGVFFRASTKEKAEQLGISGWVKNESDGAVLIEAEGQDEAHDAFTKWCAHGPTFARVKEIKVEDIPFRGYKDFAVRY